MKCFSYIRFSSPQQAKGRSRERQLESAQRFADEKGWEMDQSLCMFDSGLSGFHREHIHKGKLGVFLAAVKAGKIETPCVLIVENLDRLSRDKIPDALMQFLDITKAGISVVTLMDRQLYDYESLAKDMTQLLISISIMSRSHEESLTKQIRRTDSWNKARKDAFKGKKVTGRCVAWLKLSKDKTEFQPILSRVEAVQCMFHLYIQGHGIDKICKILTQKGIPTFSRTKNGWSRSTVSRILRTRTVLGEIQFMKTKEIINGKREMETSGDTILDYYPRIIDEKTFYKAQEQLELRKCAYGKIGARNNLFSGLVKCGYCGATMQYATRGRKQYKYLNCRESVKGNCEYLSFKYQDFEDAFLLHVTKLKLPNIIKDDISEHEKQIDEFKNELVILKNKIKQSQQKIENYSIAIGTDIGGSKDTVKHFINLIDSEKLKEKSYTELKEKIKRKISRLETVHKNTESSLKSLKDALLQIQNCKDADRESIRRKLQNEIRNLVEKIEIYPLGAGYLWLKKIIEGKNKSQETKSINLKKEGVQNSVSVD